MATNHKKQDGNLLFIALPEFGQHRDFYEQVEGRGVERDKGSVFRWAGQPKEGSGMHPLGSIQTSIPGPLGPYSGHCRRLGFTPAIFQAQIQAASSDFCLLLRSLLKHTFFFSVLC